MIQHFGFITVTMLLAESADATHVINVSTPKGIYNDDYGLKVDESFQKIMDDIYSSKDYKKEYSASELLYEFGKRIKDEGSILRQAYLHNVEVF